MIKKRENCLYCGEKMESVTAKKKFCSDLHRVYWNRENPKGKTKPKNENIDPPKEAPKSESKKELTSFEKLRNQRLGIK